MRESWMKAVLRFRTAIYIILLLTVVAIEITHLLHAQDIIDPPELFWPPDMVPHPMPPEPEPNDDNLAKWSNNEESTTLFSDGQLYLNRVC